MTPASLAGSLRGWAGWRDVTATGWVVAALGGLGLAIGAWLHWTELLLLGVTFLVVCALALVAVRLPATTRYALQVRPRRTSVGGSVAAEVAVDVGSLPLLAPEIRIPVGPDLQRLRLPVLGPGHRHVEPVRVEAARRGVHLVGPVSQVQGDPLGLCRRVVAGTEAVEVFVRPRFVALDSLAPGVVNDLEGVPSDQLSVSDLAFHALREYVAGDDLRHVHWRSSARADRLLVRQYQETRRSRAVVLVDTDADGYATDDDLELALSVATSILVRALQDDFEVSFAWGDSVVGSDASHPDPLLDATCRVEAAPAERSALRRDATRLASAVPGASLVAVIAGGRRDAAELSLAASAFGGEALRVIVRADLAARSALAEQAGIRALTVGRLEHLAPMLLRSV